MSGGKEVVNALAVSKSGELLASISRDKTIRIWRVDTGACVGTIAGHMFICVAFLPDERTSPRGRLGTRCGCGAYLMV